VPIVAFINLYADFLKRGGELNAEEFGKSAGIEVICGEAINERDVRKLKKSIFGETPILPGDERAVRLRRAEKTPRNARKNRNGQIHRSPRFRPRHAVLFLVRVRQSFPDSGDKRGYKSIIG